MTNLSRRFSLAEAKIQAQILLKNLNSKNIQLQEQSQLRISQLPMFNQNISFDEIKLKHTLAVIANENGFNSWTNLKTYFTLTGLTKFEPRGGFFNQWFSKYSEAKAMLSKAGYYLLPYKNQFFICEAGCIEYIGLDSLNPNWQKINYNWVEPNDMEAWHKLNDIYNKVKGASHD